MAADKFRIGRIHRTDTRPIFHRVKIVHRVHRNSSGSQEMASSLHSPAVPTDRSRMRSRHCDTKENVHRETSLLVFCSEAWIREVLPCHCLLLISSTDQKHPWDRIEMRCGCCQATKSDRTCCPAQTSVAS